MIQILKENTRQGKLELRINEVELQLANQLIIISDLQNSIIELTEKLNKIQ